MTQQGQRVQFAAGDKLPAITRHITQAQINAYADASGDRNPLHLDEAFARTTQFGGTIAHGMLVLAFLSEMLTGAFGRSWLETGRLKVRFRAPARPGDSIHATGHVTKIEGARVTCQVSCTNGAGETLISGEAEVSVA